MLSDKKPQFEKYLEPVAKQLSGVNPNILTLLGSIPPLLFFVSVLYHQYILALVALVGTGFDLIDGMIARKYNKVTNFGGFLDSVMDRIGDFLIISAFSFGGIVEWEITTILLFISFLISYTRAHGELRNSNKISFAVGLIERPERIVIMFFALISYILFPTIIVNQLNTAEWLFIFLSFLSFITVIQRIQYAYKKL